MKYLVTGGAGFIGSHLVDELMSLKNEVTVVDNLSSGKLEFLKNNMGKPGFTFINGDLVNSKIAGETVRDCDVVFHLSANPDARKGITDTRYDLEQEVLVTYNVLEAMKINALKKIVFASSSTVYGETPGIPIPEDYGPLLPISIYGACKLASEGMVSAFCSTFDMHAWIYRFANVVGKRATHGVIYDFINKLGNDPSELEILGDGTQCKPYIHVKDCVDGMLYGLGHASERINVFNLGSDTYTNVTAIAEMLVKAMMPGEVKFKYTGGDRGWIGDVPQVRYDVSKINKLGWHARYTSDQAIYNAINEILGK
ncbi:MAG: NAD-dependent epimerase/dehydratase family protein [Dehalococcoidia bacterium]|nr:MAG: NAD-dependent epimerase/dehydratase family protein [Dehalococcoidia bacterium]